MIDSWERRIEVPPPYADLQSLSQNIAACTASGSYAGREALDSL